MDPIFWIAAFLLLITIWEMRVTIWLPHKARAATLRGDHAAEKKILETIIRTPALTAGSARSNARFQLSWVYMDYGQYAAAAQECRQALMPALKPAAAATIRRRLADCLEGAGDMAGAEQERQIIRECLEKTGEGLEGQLARARSLADSNCHAEACLVYEQVLELIPSSRDSLRGQTMVNLSICSYRAGQPARVIQWAEAALRSSLQPRLRDLAHTMAAVGHSARGSLQEAEKHYQQALAISAAVGDPIVPLKAWLNWRGSRRSRVGLWKPWLPAREPLP